jgi:hypothetical protein
VNLEISKFCKNNKLKIKNYKKKKILIADRSLPEAVIVNSLAAYSLNKNFKFNVEVITDVSKKNDLLKVYKSFDIKKFHHVAIKYNYRNIFNLIIPFIVSLNTVVKILILGKYWFVKNFTYKNIYFGDLFYDQFAKFNLNYINNNLLSLSFFKILFIGIYKIHIINKVLNKNKYEYILSSTTVSTSVSAITTKLCLKRNIKVISLIANHFRVFKNLKEAYRSQINITFKLLDEITKKNKDWKKKINLYIKERFKGNLIDRDAKETYRNKKNFSKNELLKKLKLSKKYNRIGFFAPHAFHDTSYHQGKLVHLSLYDHFTKTVDILNKSKNTLWLIKPHPTSIFFDGKNLVRDYIISKKNKNLVLCPKDLNNYSIINFSDIIVTCRGTIALEAGCFGKKTVLGGQAFYSDLNFSCLPKNKLHYEKMLLNENLKFKLSKKEIETCKKAFFIHTFRNSYIKSNILPIDKYLDVSLKDQNVITNEYTYHRQDKKSYINYYKIINERLLKRSFLNDNFYEELNSFLKKYTGVKKTL